MSLDTAIERNISPGRLQRRRRMWNRRTLILLPWLAIATLFVVCGIAAPVLAPHDPDRLSVIERLTPPSWQSGGSTQFLLGTDHLGRDELSRLIYGARLALIVVASTIPISCAIGLVIGIAAGWKQGFLDKLLMRVVDVQLALPVLLFAILFASVFGPSLRNVILLIVLWSWSGFARIVRSEVLQLRTEQYITAARASGAGELRIILRHVIPNLADSLVILATLDISVVILTEAALSFLNVGVPLGTASWGGMIAEGQTFLTIAWWPITLPGVAIILVSLSANVLGDGLRDLSDPRLRNLR